MRSLREPNHPAKSSRVSSTASSPSVSCHVIQWYSAESINVPSISQRTALKALLITSYAPYAPGVSVPEMPASSKHHRDAVLVGRGDDFRVAHRSAGLHDG